ncbi:XopAH/AvrB family type III secretion system effector, partial [Acidovorax sp. SUPP1855]|uniref:XopAH/AvrB family type III secretion system effector n=1 Tax=Acidovorax sp. SUPP1855 TaxID=431774 RepID=UPI0024E0B941
TGWCRPACREPLKTPVSATWRAYKSRVTAFKPCKFGSFERFPDAKEIFVFCIASSHLLFGNSPCQLIWWNYYCGDILMGGCISTSGSVSRHRNSHYAESQAGKSSTSSSANNTPSHEFSTRTSVSSNTAPRQGFGEIQNSQVLKRKKKLHGTNRTGLPGPDTNSNLTRQQQSLVGVARWPDSRYNDENSSKQQSYGRSFWNATRKAGSQIANGKITSLDQLWNHVSDWRGKAAGSSSGTFGSNKRDPRYNLPRVTGVGGRYDYIRERYANRTDGNMRRNLYGLPPSMNFQIEDEINGEPISLTTLVISADVTADRDDEIYTGLRSRGQEQLGEPFHILHTQAADVPRIMEHAESLYSLALDPDIEDGQALQVMGELHWWLAHAMPDVRGSAAKAELSVRSIAQARGMDLLPFPQGFVPDLEAMTTTRFDFVNQYLDVLGWA